MASSATWSLAADSSAAKSLVQGSPSRSTVSRASAASSAETVWTGLRGWARATTASFDFTVRASCTNVNAMSPATPSATARSTRPAQRERGARRMKSSSIRCMEFSLFSIRERIAVGERFGAPGVVHFSVEFALRADDHSRDRLRQAEERALALQDLGQDVPPALVGAPAADRDPHAALDQRQRQAAGLFHHDPARAVADRFADAVERRHQERLDRGEVHVRLDEDFGEPADERAIHRAR